jgi:head-tail adaptor
VPDTCWLQRITRTADGQGGFTEGWAVEATTVCHAGRYTDQLEQNVAERLQGRAAYRLRLPYSIIPRLGDRIVTDERTFDVVGVARVPLGVHTTVVAGEVA